MPVVWADRRGSRMHARRASPFASAGTCWRIRFIHRGVKRILGDAPAK